MNFRFPIVLVSSSPQRVSLLRQIGVEPDIIETNKIDEATFAKELPGDYSVRIAKGKVESMLPKYQSSLIIGGDTVVSCGRRILCKPKDCDDAYQMLSMLSGRRHRVYSTVSLYSPVKNKILHRMVLTFVKFKLLTKEEIDWYIDMGEWQDKCGGYAIQGHAAMFIKWISGSYSAVVGMPLDVTYNLLYNYIKH